MPFRFGISILVAAAVTFGLVFLMQYLIATGKSALSEEGDRHFIDFVRVKKEEVVETKKRKPEKPPEPEAPPPSAPTPQFDNVDANMQVVNVAPASITTDEVMGVGGLGLVPSDGDYLPIVKVAPIYPRRALSRGLEGHVIVEFTVTRTGTTRDVSVVESTSSLFEKAAMAAALKFKYKPRVVDGEAIEVPGVQNKITFKLEK